MSDKVEALIEAIERAIKITRELPTEEEDTKDAIDTTPGKIPD